MKKFLAIALIAASFAACNEGEKKVEETTTTTETTVPAVDSMATPAVDSMATPAIDTTTKM